MDDDFDEMHFLNGVESFKNGSFKQRKIGKHVITYHTDYDYEMGAMRKIVRKTFQLIEDYE
jgi:cobalamin biosynthesis Co2+ chelatase CbiK